MIWREVWGGREGGGELGRVRGEGSVFWVMCSVVREESPDLSRIQH